MYLFDLHCDTLTKCYNSGKSLFVNDFSVDILSLLKFDKCIQTFAIFTDDSGRYSFDYVLNCIDFLKGFYDENFIEFSDNAENIGKVNAILSIENLSFIGHDLTCISKLREKGVRIASLTWNGKNHFASGVNSCGGLTSFGKQALKKLEKCGIVIDVSHLNDSSFFDVLKHSVKPIIATHSNCRSVCDNKRNLTDEQIISIVKNNGLIGINFYPLFINGTDKYGYNDLFKHINHFIKLNATDNICIGSDFDGCVMNRPIKNICDLNKLFFAVLEKYGIEIAEKLFYNNAYKFFMSLE